jgi:ribosomal protein L19
MVNDLKENEKKTKSKYGVFNGNTISQDTFGVEKSLVIKKIDSTEEDFTIEKIKEQSC